MNLLGNVCTAVGLFVAATLGHAAEVAERVELSLPSQPLTKALNAFAQQADLRIIVSMDDAGSLQSQALSGSYTPQAALDRLLERSNLTYVFVGKRTVEIRRLEASKQKSPDAATTNRTSWNHDGDAAIRVADASANSAAGHAPLPQPADDGAGIEQIVVTGSHIRGVAIDASPLTVISRQEISRSGAATVSQLMRTVPQNFSIVDASTARISGGNADANENAFFGSAVNLHGLGPGATLVLLDGHRLAPAGSNGAWVDVSLIPLSAVERIEMLTDGASSVYGADAVAGVVNFVLRRKYEGAETQVRYGASADGGARERSVTQLLGTAGNAGSVMLTYEYHDQDALRTRDRDFVPLPPEGPNPSLTLLPEERRNTVLLNGRTAFGGKTEVFGNALFSSRDFAYDNVSLSGLNVEHIDGTARQLGAVLGVERDLGGSWRLTASGNFSRVEQESDTAANGLFRSYAGRTEVVSFDAIADGRLLSLPGGDVRASLGAGVREEKFHADPVSDGVASTPAEDLDRTVSSVYGELLVPVVGRESEIPGIRRLEIQASGRYDRYAAFGSSVQPKIGLMWEPVQALRLRGSVSRSFRAPPLRNLNEINGYQLVSIPDPSAPGGITDTIFILGAGNAGLQAERSRTRSVGLDFTPAFSPATKLSATYFDVRFTNRISPPPIVGNIFGIYLQPALAPYIDRSPDPAEIALIASGAKGQFFNAGGPTFTGIDPALTDAFFDFRPQNLAVTRQSGLELSVATELETAYGAFTLSVAGNRLYEIDYQPVSTVPVVDLLNRTFQPMDWRMRTAASWSYRGFSSALNVNYSGGYRNDLVPGEDIASWTTVDLQVAFDAGSMDRAAFLEGVTLSLSAINLLDRAPPGLDYGRTPDYNFDPSNASPRGRYVAVQVAKRW